MNLTKLTAKVILDVVSHGKKIDLYDTKRAYHDKVLHHAYDNGLLYEEAIEEVECSLIYRTTYYFIEGVIKEVCKANDYPEGMWYILQLGFKYPDAMLRWARSVEAGKVTSEYPIL